MTHQHAFRYDMRTDDYRCACGAVESKLVMARPTRWSDLRPCTAFRGGIGMGGPPKSFCINCGWSASAHVEAQLPDRVRSGRELLSC